MLWVLMSLARQAGKKHLIQACKKLRRFIFLNWNSHDDPLDSRRQIPLLDEADILEALQPHRNTLDHLRIEFPDYRTLGQTESCPKLPGGKMPSLRRLHRYDRPHGPIQPPYAAPGISYIFEATVSSLADAGHPGPWHGTFHGRRNGARER